MTDSEVSASDLRINLPDNILDYPVHDNGKRWGNLYIPAAMKERFRKHCESIGWNPNIKAAQIIDEYLAGND